MKRAISLVVITIICLSFHACTNKVATKPATAEPAITSTKNLTAASATATPTSTAAPVPKLDTDSAEIHTAETLRLTVKDFDGKIAWASSDPYIAAVDNNGNVTGMHKAGVANITAMAGDKTLTCAVTNLVALNDISATELVSKIKIGSNFSAMDNIDFSFKIGYDDYANSSSRIFINFAVSQSGKPGDYSSRGVDMYKGQTVHQTISLDCLKDCDPAMPVSRAFLSAFYHGSGSYSGKMTIKVSNAKITADGKVYKLDYLNGTNTMITRSDYNQQYDCWACFCSIGDAKNSGLPNAADLSGGVFEADMTIVDVTEANRPDKATYYLTNESMVNPPTKQMIDALKDAGYDAVRLTVSYTPFTNNDTFVIDPAWLDKVEEVTNWILSNNMYCIMDTHSDYLGNSWVGDHWSGAWMMPKYQAYVDARFTAIWKQIADRFKGYDDTLLFESMNEPCMFENEYIAEGGKPNAFNAMQADRVNELNGLFYSTVVNSGGNNAKRFLMLPCVGEVYGHLDSLKLPDSNKIIASVHSYFFDKGNGKFTDTFEGKQASYDAVVDKDLNKIDAFMKKTGVPIIIGEFGNTEVTENSARIYQATYLVQKAAAIGVPCFWWECGVDKNKDASEHFGLYDRKSMSWAHQDLLQAIITAAKN